MRKNYSIMAALAALACAAAVSLALAQTASKPAAKPASKPLAASSAAVDMVAGMPAAIDPNNLYSEIASSRMSPAVAGSLERVYVPNRSANTVSVIDPNTLKVVDTFKVGVHPQHIVPSWDLRVLWVANNAEGRTDGSLTPIDPKLKSPWLRSKSPRLCAKSPQLWAIRVQSEMTEWISEWRCVKRIR